MVVQFAHDVDAIDEELDRLKARQNGLIRHIDWLKAMMLQAVDGAFGGKVKTPRFTVYSKKNADGLEIVVDQTLGIGGFAVQHPELVRIKEPELNKTAIKEAFEAGTDLAGLIITPVPGKRSLRIK